MSAGNAAILKKLGESLSRSHSSTSSSHVPRDTSWGAARNAAWIRNRSVVADEARTGEKRKRDILPSGDGGTPLDQQEHASKRRSSSSSSSFQSSSTMLPRAYPPPRQMEPRESTITTPSLCSDKGRDDDDDSDERLPSTPPAPADLSTRGYVPVRKVFAPPPRSEREVIDVDMDVYHGTISVTPPPPSKVAVGARRIPLGAADVFAKRPPSSPMPAQSPRKPRPPSRTARALPPPPPPAETEDEDELSLSFNNPGSSSAAGPPPAKGKAKPVTGHDKLKTRGHAPPPRSQSPLPPLSLLPPRREKERASAVPSAASASASSRGTATGGKNRRRQTLDEELRSAVGPRSRSRSYSRSSQHDRERELELELESGTLVGDGTRPKNRAFLARGGGGGEPVLMGVGYVLGVKDEDLPDEDVGAGNTSDDGNDGDYEPPVAAAGRRKRKGNR
ncbi:hypothetical protein B0H15DRAFT_354564 [Mycena belliarum]|uniref:Uncharacterized protein n=1 Tax=Mycena belliarum TaxID=1033014 RepID=A0AAD6U0Q4_9AGAR|nr:hypothetical protein B0H15DRAFT_354564 [Mycena belliae]